jgi:cytochrome c-type biogenesis protein CcmH/NrfG
LLRSLGVGALAGLAAVAVHSAVDFSLRIPSNATLAAFLAALAAAASGSRPLRAPALVAALPLAVLVGLWLARPEPDEDVFRRAIAGAASATLPEARVLRLTQAEGALTARLGRRPADAEAWLLLAWTRASGANGGAAVALARHAVSLDPERDGLRAAADAIIRSVEQAHK